MHRAHLETVGTCWSRSHSRWYKRRRTRSIRWSPADRRRHVDAGHVVHDHGHVYAQVATAGGVVAAADGPETHEQRYEEDSQSHHR